MANDNNQLGKNIQHLREMYGETLDELKVTKMAVENQTLKLSIR